MPKRKAESSPEKKAPQKSARQKREEAKARAREWAERELKSPSTITTPTRKARTAVGVTRKSTPARKSTPSRKTTPSRTKPADVQSPEPATKKRKLDEKGSAKKLTKKELRERDKQKAQEWAEQEFGEEKKSASKKPAAAASPKRAKSPAAAASSPKRASQSSAPAQKLPPRPIPSANNGDTNLWTQQRVAEIHAAQQQAAQQLAAQQQAAQAQRIVAQQQQQEAARHQWMKQHQEQYAAQQQQYTAQQQQAAAQQQGVLSPEQQYYLAMQAHQRAQAAAGYNPWQQQNYAAWVAAQAAASAAPPPAATGNPLREAQEALSPGRTPPRKTTKKRKTPVKKTSVKKVETKKAPVKSPSATATTAETVPPNEAQDTTSPKQQEEDGVEVEGSITSKRFRFLPHSLKLLVLPVIVAVGAYFAVQHFPSEALETVKQPDEPVLPPCFISNPREENQVFENCDHSKRTLRCPTGGRCSRGQLQSCVEPHLDVSPSRDLCVLSAATNTTLTEVETLLADWTTHHVCSITGCVHAISSPDKRAPFFNLELVHEEIEGLNESLLSFSDSFVVLSDGDDKAVIGLTDEYLDTKLIVPFWCYLGLLSVQGLELLLSALVYVGTWVTGFALNLTVAFPVATVGFFLIVWAVYAFRNRRKARAQLRQDVATVRDLTYGKLVEDVTSEHFAIHLRDAVAMDLYPASKTKRAYICNKVWPRVVADVKLDNRVLKSTKLFAGTPRDVWKWTASSTPGKK